MNFIWKYVKKYPGKLLITFIATIGTAAVMIGLPTLLAQMIDNAIITQNIPLLWRYTWIMMGLVVLSLVSRTITAYTVSNIVNDMVMNIRNDAYKKMQNLSHHEFQELGVASLTTRISTDAFVILQFMEMTLKQGLVSPMMLIFSIIMIFSISPALGIYVIPVSIIIILSVIFIAKYTLPISEKQQASLDNINRILRENITGLRVIRAFNNEHFQEGRFKDVNQSYKKQSGKLFKTIAVTPALFSLLLNTVIIAILWFGAGLIETGSMQVGIMVAFIEYVFHALFSLLMFANIFMMYPRAAVSAGRLREVMDMPITVASPDPQVAITESDEFGTLEFRDVDFAYPDASKPVLRNISFKTNPGETVAFIGSTGSGKSTIVKLIPRFYDVSKGQILIDGIDVRNYELNALRSKIGYTPQKALLFTGDIAENLRYGKFNADDMDLDRATNVAQASEFINRLETKYATHLDEGGANLSGGQKQRLSIARSIIADREIYIFDDSFSALDYKTDAAVRQALKDETQNATTIIVAQRVSSIIHADQIIVLDEGEVAARGTHKELLKTSELYYEIASSQLSEEELNRG
ncbi:ATP-binding cassette, subfamily B, multidrug efflux pump [Aerococcus sp. 150760007-1]|uniref:ABC transporter ATP-binding protein n=1 Tax=Aerococcus urinaeequi TaxID=51665 RepID=A0ABR5ZYG1_9LACT|nr:MULTISPECIES: ABC transporter ATP-binding protein [Lactobacillales]KAF3301538.1 ATP-binding cassette domain-containing protein [Carnobacterium sp. PL17RED31]KAF3303289.1 ATP-binding cassette domain-containing protein [Carnobacterium sp. PL26RED25]KAF3306573.1 ATP-binding cassette domain-containing protein [Carnobacterium sp. PL24RED07]MBA5746759.1 ABC transporter ATP-binding protein [Aerococcus urinaeequi]MBA5829446.1 ABC transporter ATP-binding protein [Aerococcus urinaeequi]